MNDQASNQTPREDKSPRHRGRRWILGIAGVVALLALAVLLLPTILSTGPGSRMVMGYLSSTIAGSLDADRLRLAWFSGQSAMGVTLADPQGDLVASIRQIDAPDVRLLPFLLGSPQYGQVTIDAEVIQVNQPAGERTNLERALEPADPAPDEPDEGIDEDLSLQLTFTADRVTYGSPGIEQVELTDLDVALNVPDIRRIAAQVHSNLMHGDQPGRIDLDLQLNDGFTADGDPQFDAASVQARGELTNFPTAMADRLMGQEGRLALLLGDQLDTQFTATGPVRSLEADVQAQSPHLTADVQLVGDEQTIRAAEGSQLQLEVTPPAFAAWFAPPAEGEQPPATLVQPFTLDVQLAELTLPREAETGMDLAGAAINLQATAGDIVLDLPATGRMTLGQPRLGVQSAALGEQVTANLQTQATVGDVSEPVSAELALRNLLMGDDQPLAATLEATALPLALADVLADQDGLLVLMLGETLNTTVNLERTSAGDMTFAGQVQTPRLQGPFTGAYGADGALSLQTPEAMVWRLSPQGFARLAGGDPPRMGLEQDAEVSVNIDQLDVAMLAEDDLQAPAEVVDAEADAGADAEADPPMRFDPERTRIVATVSSPLLVGRDLAANEPFRVEAAQLNVRGQDLRQLLEIDLEATIEHLRQQAEPAQPPAGAEGRDALEQRISRPADAPAAGDAPQQPAAEGQAAAMGQIRSQTRIAGLLSDAGDVQPGLAQIRSDTTLTNVPSSLLDALSGQGGALAAVLGARTSASAEVDYQGAEGGTVDFNLESNNARATVPGRITSQRVLELRSPATATLTVTPEMGSAVLATINPFLNAISADRPVTLTVQDEGFAMPLESFAMADVRANAQLDLGTLRLQQGNLARTLFTALSVVGGRFDPGQTYDAQFTPMSFGVEEGVLSYDDLTMQFSGITLGFRGNVDYEGQRFNLVMALPAASLGQLAPGLERAVGPDDALEVPITGTFDEPRLDSAAMSRELTQLALQAGLREAVGGEGNGGAGGLLDIITGRRPQRGQPPAEEDEPERTEPDEEEEEEAERDPVRDIFDIIRGRQQQNSQ
ncbi:MAG: hypothetical protein WDZ31_08855 [Phycisphaeraceae bacterium]